MNGLRRVLLVLAAGGLLAVASIALPTPAGAQALPPLPAEQLSPVLELISPIAWPLCGDAVLVAVAPAAVGVAIPPELTALFGPLIVLCGAVPQPDGRRICALDTQAQDLIAQLSKSLIGSPLPLLITPIDSVAGQLVLVSDLAPQLALPMEATVDAVLQCNPPAAPTTTQPGAVDAPAPTDPAPTTADLPTFQDLQALPPLLPPTTPLPIAVPVRTPTETPIVLISEPRFAYPVVMGLPLLLLVLGAYLGRSLTRPIHTPEDPT